MIIQKAMEFLRRVWKCHNMKHQVKLLLIYGSTITCHTLSGETWVSDNNKGNNVLLRNTNWSSTQHNNVSLINLNECVIENRIFFATWSSPPHSSHTEILINHLNIIPSKSSLIFRACEHDGEKRRQFCYSSH